MASDVDICNLALSHLGDEATVASLDPPEGSAQAEHCARWYPVARDALLEMHPWGFATTRAPLAELSNPPSTWAHVYAQPTGAINLLAVLAPDAPDDYSVTLMPLTVQSTLAVPSIMPTGGNGVGLYTPQPFVHETLADGTEVIYTNQPDAHLRYTRKITDTTKFSPLFVKALARYLASLLAGPVLKGAEGRAEGVAQLRFFNEVELPQAKTSDSSQRRLQVTQNVPWITGR